MRKQLAAAAAILGMTWSVGASAADGCTVLLCLAGDWRHISQCRGPVKAALRDMAKGRPFPTCSMSSGPGGSASVGLVGADCPPQYTTQGELGNECRFSRVVNVMVDGQLWSRVWFAGDDSITEYSDAAKAQLGAERDMRFETDLAAWTAIQQAAQAQQPAYDAGGS